MMKKMFFMAVMSIFLLLSSDVYAKRYPEDDDKCGPRHEERFDRFCDELAKDLDLNEEQQKKIKENHKNHMEKRKELYKEVKEKREELKKELDKTKTDKAKVDKIVGELKSLNAKMIDLRVEKVLEMKDVLTPKQYEKLSENMEKKHKKMMKKGKGNKKHMRNKMRDHGPMGDGSMDDRPMDE
ncbi:MAG: periplasmic heavy metal sensor [Endomicrobiales bacterium]|nr:periplasmic heavy metal sensor [Endomicrobiales bacterium]